MQTPRPALAGEHPCLAWQAAHDPPTRGALGEPFGNSHKEEEGVEFQEAGDRDNVPPVLREQLVHLPDGAVPGEDLCGVLHSRVVRVAGRALLLAAALLRPASCLRH